ANESGQTLSFMVTNNNNALFSAQPAVSSTGTLTFTPAAPPTSGVATVSVTLMDNGGTANGGDDTSAAQMFMITVNDFALTGNCTSGMPPCTGATTATINAGQSVNFDINATAMQSAVMQTVNFSCANLPFGAACNFTPASLTNVPTTGTTVMLTVTTTAPSAASFLGQGAPRPASPAPLYAFWLSIPGLAAFGLVLAGRSNHKRGVAALCLLALLLVMAGLLGACGNALDIGEGGMPGTPTGTHPVTVTATAGSSQRALDIMVTVQ
ncbi:MAG: hypothetical protein HYY26_00445, partial [Acidobacteria bacterium]|nr:hypothetical protein [Acidobacteriota bacterium]